MYLLLQHTLYTPYTNSILYTALYAILKYTDKASSRAYKPPPLTENADMFSARGDIGAMIGKIASGNTPGFPF